MALVIPDEALKAAGLNERDGKIEIAARLFDAGKLTIGHAARLAELQVHAFEKELESRDIPRWRYTDHMLERDIATLEKLGRW